MHEPEVVGVHGIAIRRRERAKHLAQQCPAELHVGEIVAHELADHAGMGLEPVEGKEIEPRGAADLAAALQDDERADTFGPSPLDLLAEILLRAEEVAELDVAKLFRGHGDLGGEGAEGREVKHQAISLDRTTRHQRLDIPRALSGWISP